MNKFLAAAALVAMTSLPASALTFGINFDYGGGAGAVGTISVANGFTGVINPLTDITNVSITVSDGISSGVVTTVRTVFGNPVLSVVGGGLVINFDAVGESGVLFTSDDPPNDTYEFVICASATCPPGAPALFSGTGISVGGAPTLEAESGTLSFAAVPVPAALPLLLSGIAAIGFVARRRRGLTA
jgi:hypothetical protein